MSKNTFFHRTPLVAVSVISFRGEMNNETNPAGIPPVNLKFDTNFKRSNFKQILHLPGWL